MGVDGRVDEEEESEGELCGRLVQDLVMRYRLREQWLQEARIYGKSRLTSAPLRYTPAVRTLALFIQAGVGNLRNKRFEDSIVFVIDRCGGWNCSGLRLTDAPLEGSVENCNDVFEGGDY